MKNDRLMIAFCLVLIAANGYSVPLIGKAVGGAVERAVAHEVAEAAAKQALKTGAERGMSSALAGVTAKQLMAGGVMVATPIAAYNLSAGPKSVDEARAEVIRTTGAAVAKEIPTQPELAAATLTAVDGGGGSPFTRMRRWVDQALPWVCGIFGLVCLLYLAGALLNGIACARRGIAALTAMRRETDGIDESVAIDREHVNV